MRSCLKKYLASQGYAHLFYLALLGEVQGFLVSEPSHLAGYRALGEAQPLCDFGNSSRLILIYIFKNPFLFSR